MHRFPSLLFSLAAAIAVWGESLPASATEPARETFTPHVALLLPLTSSAFAQHAERVKLGFLAAVRVDHGSGLPVRVYVTSDQPDDVIASYSQALGMGAKVVVGPLGKNSVTAVIKSGLVSVPTLALSQPDEDLELPPQLYVFGIQIENEARWVAHLALNEGKRRALIINGTSALDKRLTHVFLEEWVKFGGERMSQFDYKNYQSALLRLPQIMSDDAIDVVFLALETAKARTIRSYLDNRVPVYATSEIFLGSHQTLANFDLDKVRFVDMPWMLQPDHPAVMTYAPEAEGQGGPEFERFYALGIDAYRLALALLSDPDGVYLDGVTGEITLRANNQFMRRPLSAMFIEGKATLRRDFAR